MDDDDAHGGRGAKDTLFVISMVLKKAFNKCL